MNKNFYLQLVALLIFNSVMFSQTTIYVDSAAIGSNNGSDWTNAYTSLQTALENAISGDKIWVSKGTYLPSKEVDGTTDTQRKYAFKMVEGVAIYGGFAGTEAAESERTDFGYGGANETILSGDFNGDDVISGSGSSLSITNNSENAYHVIYHPASYSLTSSAILDGFSIIAGNASGSANPYNDGAGLYNSDGQIPTINNCSFYGNRSSDNGGAIMNVNSDNMVLSNCKMFNNYAADDGAAISNYSSDLQIINCVMNGNRSASNGGGVYNYSASNPSFINCTIVDNYAVSGGGLYNDENSDPTVTNCILWGNTLSSGSGTQIRNYSSSDLTISYCDVEGGLSVGITSTTAVIDNGGNIDSDPKFATSANNSSHPYSISSVSPCADAGQNDSCSSTTDIRGAGYERKLSKTDGSSGTIDIGAYEYNYIEDLFDPNLIFVNHDATGNNSGINWKHAYTSFQSALEASSSGKQIWVAKGTYKPSLDYGLNIVAPNTERGYHFRLINNVEIYGGFAGTENSILQRSDYSAGGTNETILSGDIGTVDDNSDNSYHIFYLPIGLNIDSTAVLDGFTIYKGYANGTYPHERGAGIFNVGNSPTIRNCCFVENEAPNSSGTGGAIYNFNSSGSLNNCIFTSNSSYQEGGALYCYGSPFNLDNCLFSGNSSRSGGAIYTSASISISNSTFKNNFTANINGTGGAIESVSASPQITNCLFTGNSASHSGSWIYIYAGSPTIINCTAADNQASTVSGMYNWGNTNLVVKNTIIWNNSSSYEITNNSGTTPTFSNCVIKGSGGSASWNSTFGIDGGNNIDRNPQFVGSSLNASHPYSIYGSSPCVDAGDDAANSETYDVRGNGFGRKLAKADGSVGTIDIGAYEYKYGTDPEKFSRIYVDASVSLANSGYNWDEAFSSLQDALDLASSGSEIWVAKGTYKPSKEVNGTTDTPREYTFVMKDSVAIYGGFAGTETDLSQRANFGISEANETILSGDLNGDDVVTGSGSTLTFSNNGENCYNVIKNSLNYLDDAAILDGFTISGGYSSTGGGGMYNFLSSPRIINCTFTKNSAVTSCGGVYVGGTTTAISFENCTFSNNLAEVTNSTGGGLRILTSNNNITLTNCNFSGNRAALGGGLHNASNTTQISNCTFSNNAGFNGGGIYNLKTSMIIKNSKFLNNSASNGGGFYFNDSSATVTNCLFNGNSASNVGGGIFVNNYKGALINCTFTGNSAPNNGGGIYLTGAVGSTITNTIIWSNTSITGGQNIYTAATAPNISYCNIEGSGGSSNWGGTAYGTDGGNNIDSDPLFVGSGDNPYVITGVSPCADAGDNSVNSETYDLRGSGFARKLSKIDGTGGTIDIGAYEYLFESDPLPVELTSYTATSTENGIVINWQTATEVNNYGFEVERMNQVSSIKIKDQSWETIGFVEGHGNSNSVKDYTFVDTDYLIGTVQYRLKQIDIDGGYEYSDVVEITTALPKVFKLDQNFPNPFNPTTVINYSLPEATNVELKVYNMLGQEVATLVNQMQQAGNYQAKFNASNLASGFYIYNIKTEKFNSVKKMLLVK